MDNYKIIMILIFVFFLNDKNTIFVFIENLYEKNFLKFGCMHANKTYFCFFRIRKFFEFLIFF